MLFSKISNKLLGETNDMHDVPSNHITGLSRILDSNMILNHLSC